MHKGAVRGIDFHPIQCYYCSGGDDGYIIVKNYKTKQNLWKNKAHEDYIRVTNFHNELPWILSCSDDQTLRIWNWQSRQLIALLTGHSHYVMCAQFHPTQNLIVSSSLDRQIRLWDYTTIKKNITQKQQHVGQYSNHDIEIRAVLEGHERGVNWVAFHPTENYIASAADDKKIKIWKFDHKEAWDIDSLYAHTNNVSCVQFHPKYNQIISCSEDNTIRVWCMDKRSVIADYKCEGDRFWCLAIHPSLNYITSGHDSGSVVLGIYRESQPSILIDDQFKLIYGYHSQLKFSNLKDQGKDYVIKSFEEATTMNVIDNNILDIQFNNFEQANYTFLVKLDVNKSKTKKYCVLQLEGQLQALNKPTRQNQRFFYANKAYFISKNQVVRQTDSNQLDVYNFKLETVEKPLADQIILNLFAPCENLLLIQTEDSIKLLDINKSYQVDKSIQFESKIKFAKWSLNKQFLAVCANQSIYFYSAKKLEKLGNIQEKFEILSIRWGQNSMFIYNTINHLKYSLLNGETGILTCLEQKFSIAAFPNAEGVALIDLNGEVHKKTINSNEMVFKYRLFNQDFEAVKTIQNDKFYGNSMVQYMHQKNFSAIALLLVKDEKAKFSLALNSSKLKEAHDMCVKLNTPSAWKQLAEEAQRQGNHSLIEKCYKNLKDYDKLSILYTVTGQYQKLQKMLEISEERGAANSQFSDALMLGNLEKRIYQLVKLGQNHLAYQSALNHGLNKIAENIKQLLNKETISPDFTDKKPKLIIPPRPLIQNINLSEQAKFAWPHDKVSDVDALKKATKGLNEAIVSGMQVIDKRTVVQVSEPIQIKYQEQPKQNNNTYQQPEEIDDAEGWEIEDEDIVVQPKASQNISEQIKNYKYIHEYSLNSIFEQGQQLLQKQLGIYDIQPLKAISDDIYDHGQNKIDQGFITEQVKIGEDFITKGKFSNSAEHFRQILYYLPFCYREDIPIQSMINRCLCNIIVSQSCNQRGSPQREIELNCIAATLPMASAHRILTVNQAMIKCHKAGNHQYAAKFASLLKSLLQKQSPTDNLRKKMTNANNVISAAEQNGNINRVNINYDINLLTNKNALFLINPAKLEVMQESAQKVKCTYCKLHYPQSYSGQLCNICSMGKIYN